VLPLPLTAALFEDQVKALSVAVDGNTVTVTMPEPPGAKDRLVGLTEMELTATGPCVTVTVQAAL
jgi:hypothetical protein